MAISPLSKTIMPSIRELAPVFDSAQRPQQPEISFKAYAAALSGLEAQSSTFQRGGKVNGAAIITRVS
jgi:hypothetical protein